MLYYKFKLYFISFHTIYKFCEMSYPVCIQLGSAKLNIVNKIFFWVFKHTDALLPWENIIALKMSLDRVTLQIDLITIETLKCKHV